MNEFGSSVGSTRTDAIHGSEFGPLPRLLIVEEYAAFLDCINRLGMRFMTISERSMCVHW